MKVHIGNVSFSPKHAEVIRLTSDGFKNSEIASIIGTTEFVIKNCLKDIYDVTGHGNRVELALWYVNKTFGESEYAAGNKEDTQNMDAEARRRGQACGR